jgi:hypothetical protein
VALLDDRASDGLGDVAFPCPGWSQEKRVFVLGHEMAGGKVEDEPAVHLFVEVEVESIERAIPVAKAGGPKAAIEQAVGSHSELVVDQAGDQVKVGEILGLGFSDPRLEGGRHAAEPELPEGAVYFDQVHSGVSLVIWSMYER